MAVWRCSKPGHNTTDFGIDQEARDGVLPRNRHGPDETAPMFGQNLRLNLVIADCAPIVLPLALLECCAAT